MPSWKITAPKGDTDYFERMTKALFTAGLNWGMIEKKWPNFRKAFAGFSLPKVAKFAQSDLKRLMKDEGIVRNERKIIATVYNAAEFLSIQKEFGSFKGYLDSFGKDEARLQTDIRSRFKHLGPSTARTFL